MKNKFTLRAVALSLICVAVAASCSNEPAPQYTEDWESLQNYEAPEWYEDAKLGYWVHWGVYSVPAFGGNHAAEWYGRWMYSDKDQSNGIGVEFKPHHTATYGELSEFGYKDFVPMFKAEKFDADQWADLFVEGGAKYFTMMGAHHDSFCMWDSECTEWNSMDMGPKRDCVGEIAEAVRSRGLKFGVSNHLGWNYMFFVWNHINGCDVDAAPTLYGYPAISKPMGDVRWDGKESRTDWLKKIYPFVKPSDKDLEKWTALTTELCDKYEPDLYYFDWGFNIPEFEGRRKYFGAHYYNKAIEWGKGEFGKPNVVLNHKNAYPEGSAVLDHERGRSSEIQKYVWQTDDSVYSDSWGYAEGMSIKSVNTIVDELIDIVSKRGVLMLSLAPKADGTIPEEQQDLVRGVGAWLKVCGKAIYATRPWNLSGESCKTPAGEESIEVRFTRSKDSKTLYATMLDWSDEPFVIASANSAAIPAESIKRVSLIGSDQKVEWSIGEQGMTIALKDEPAYGFAYPIQIELK